MVHYEITFQPNIAKLPAARRRMICDSVARNPYPMPPWAYDGDKIIFVLGGHAPPPKHATPAQHATPP